MTFFHNLQNFFEELRQEGIPITPSLVSDCCQALLLVDWLNEECFYSALFTTLVKDYAYCEAFNNVYNRYFGLEIEKKVLQQHMLQFVENELKTEEISGVSGGENQLIPGLPSNNNSPAPSSGAYKNPMEQDFGLANQEDIRKMENFFPLIARRLAAKMIKKKKYNDQSNINYRRTIRKSMATGGIPVDIITWKKSKEKPVILALCDVSSSVMSYSSFALSLLAASERFFRHISIFAFIDEVDEITRWLSTCNPLDLRSHIFKNAQVVGESGYSNYGHVFKSFFERYINHLSHKTSVLIFGDARNNWFTDESWVLQEIQSQVKKVYWFNPEPKEEWGQGDSRMNEYLKYCDKAFACPNLIELEKAISQL